VTADLESISSAFASIVGGSRVVSETAACAALSVDGKVPRLVVRPASADQVPAILGCAGEHDVAVIACGSGTKLSIGSPPRRYDVALLLDGMNRVWHYEPADLTITVEPGMKLGDFQDHVGRDGLWLPLDPAGGPRASLGGILATNSAGSLRLSYGAPRDMVLGMKIATTEGKLIKTGGRVVKNVVGYDLGKLLVGSYGTLGVIVEASLKLFPLPGQRATFVLPAGTLGIARDLRRRILDSPLQPMRMVLLNGAAVTLVEGGVVLAQGSEEPELWVEMGGSPRVIERSARELEALGKATGVAVRPLEPAAAQAAWSRVSGFRALIGAAFSGAAILKVLLPDAASEEFLSRAEQEAENDKVPLAAFGQMGVGVLHLCVLEPASAVSLAALIKRLRGAAQALGGVLVVEHCHWDIKSRVDVWGTAGDGLAVMSKLKAAWDPKGILAPGRFVGGL
jgi:glycolate oxidase FAD binding subunit